MPQTEWLKQQKCVVLRSGGEKPKIKVTTGVGPSEAVREGCAQGLSMQTEICKSASKPGQAVRCRGLCPGPGFKPQLCYGLAEWSRESYVTSLSSDFISGMERVVISAPQKICGRIKGTGA